LLIEGLANLGIVEYDKDKVMKNLVGGELQDYSSEDVEKMAQEVYRVIHGVDDTAKVPREQQVISLDTIGIWLKGGTNVSNQWEDRVSPDDWKLYRKLESINPQFKDYDFNDKTPNGLFYNYWLRRKVRAGMRRFIESFKDSDVAIIDDRERGEYEGPGEQLVQERDIILNQFMHRIDDTFSVAKIIGIEKVLDDGNLPIEGVVMQKSDYNGKYNSMLEAFRDFSALDAAVKKFVVHYFIEQEGYETDFFSNNVDKVVTDLVCRQIMYPELVRQSRAARDSKIFMGNLGQEIPFRVLPPNFKIGDTIDTTFHHFMIDQASMFLLAGAFDEYFGTGHDEILKLVEQRNRLYLLIPEDVHKYLRNREQISNLQRFIGEFNRETDDPVKIVDILKPMLVARGYDTSKFYIPKGSERKARKALAQIAGLQALLGDYKRQLDPYRRRLDKLLEENRKIKKRMGIDYNVILTKMEREPSRDEVYAAMDKYGIGNLRDKVRKI